MRRKLVDRAPHHLAGWVRENMAHLVPNPPQVTAGATHGVRPEVTV